MKRRAKSRDTRTAQGEHDLALQKLIHDYLQAKNLSNTARSLVKEVASEAKHFKSLSCPDSLQLVYKTYLNVKELSRSMTFNSEQENSQVSLVSQHNEHVSRSPGKLPPPPPPKPSSSLAYISGGNSITSSRVTDNMPGNSSSAPLTTLSAISLNPSGALSLPIPSSSSLLSSAGIGSAPLLSPHESSASLVKQQAPEVSEESQKQYAFGWKRYEQFCQQRGWDPLARSQPDSGNSPASQVLEFARDLMENPDKAFKPSAANSYISAIGKRLVEAKVINTVRDIRTPSLKELFADVGRKTSSTSVSGGVSTGTQSSFIDVSRRSCSIGTSTTNSGAVSVITTSASTSTSPLNINVYSDSKENSTTTYNSTSTSPILFSDQEHISDSCGSSADDESGSNHRIKTQNPRKKRKTGIQES